MKILYINQAKPNPSGKDRLGMYTPPSQLTGEWVDFKNIGDEAYPLENIQLWHIAYPTRSWKVVSRFSGALPVGKIIRVHSGRKINLSEMPLVDRQGAHYHIFTNQNYVWNNSYSDSPHLHDVVKRIKVDEATYDAYPPEGRILVRVSNNKLA